MQEREEQIEYLADEIEGLKETIERISEPVYIVVPFKEGKQQDTELVTRIRREAFNEASYLAGEYSNVYIFKVFPELGDPGCRIIKAKPK